MPACAIPHPDVGAEHREDAIRRTLGAPEANLDLRRDDTGVSEDADHRVLDTEAGERGTTAADRVQKTRLRVDVRTDVDVRQALAQQAVEGGDIAGDGRVEARPLRVEERLRCADLLSAGRRSCPTVSTSRSTCRREAEVAAAVAESNRVRAH